MDDTRAMPLGRLAAALGLPCHNPDILITHISSDSRQIGPGGLFVAYRGVRVDGHRFVEQAVAAGASAIVGEQAMAELSLPYLRVSSGRWALGMLAAAWEGFPSRRLGVIGVTGTDGKTTTSNFIHSILTAAGLRAGMLTTVNARIGDQVYDTGLHTTTPDAPDLQSYLRRMADAGSDWAVLETTSHGLSQWRVAGVDYDIAVVTNITHEHLDEHGDYEGYLRAKGRLLEMLNCAQPKPGIPKAVIFNADDRSFARLRGYPAPRLLTYGLEQGDVRAEGVQHGPSGLRFDAVWEGRRLRIETPFIGRFNVYNSLAAIAVALALNLPEEVIHLGLAQAPAIPGRMEIIDRGQDFLALVDFAHTPFALAAALETARALTDGRVIVVFGSAGLRDVAKRRMMGEVAGRLADLAVITAEDPRTEDLGAMMAASARACEAAGGVAVQVPDRYRAIQRALQEAQAGDVVLVCGKGHEQSMCFGEIEYPWDDRIALGRALEVHLGLREDAPPFLLPTYGSSESVLKK
ncbi:MAG TPA: UDP-N-acetylmuramoyl-L-alanyl-D-glutamate--2,6-diaminopimelate ligase [Caldilineae bacterium]|nr:UDP-N-acetylmuramoyl-L-alanyl-D-glutamate--2,6-diaminopimelate ligase [Caldilineae bacterium]HIQ11931.1 UDP-N-acetylmuramoyl-L-alanyl-D-glutamate--2,6-diaminopimelate ligase [Caldilineales bacterium]